MPYEELTALLWRARGILERHMFEPDGGAIRDDVAEVCMAIDDAMPEDRRLSMREVDLKRTAA
jgi:hypothetical protein